MDKKQPSGNLLDLMTPEHREQAISRFRKRMEKREHDGNKVTNEIYLISEFGFYYGWDGIKAIRNNEITMKEVFILLEGARKVWYAKNLEINNMRRIANEASNPFAKKSNKISIYDKGTKQFVERAKVKE